MSPPHARAVFDPDEDGDRCIRAAVAILVSYLALTTLPMLRAWNMPALRVPLLAHVGVLTIASIALLKTDHPHLRSVRAWLPLLLGPFLYIELRWLIVGAGFPHHDTAVASWEAFLFPSDPSRTLAVDWASLALSETLHLAYVSYYALIYVPPLALWLRRRRRAFDATMLALAVVYAACFFTYVMFPVDGPRFLHGASAAPDGPIRAAVMRLLAGGSSRGTAFPSSHVAASVVASICALRFQPRLGSLVAFLSVLLAIGAVYGGYHYATDIIAGLATGLLSSAVAFLLEQQLTRGRPTTQQRVAERQAT